MLRNKQWSGISQQKTGLETCHKLIIVFFIFSDFVSIQTQYRISRKELNVCYKQRNQEVTAIKQDEKRRRIEKRRNERKWMGRLTGGVIHFVAVIVNTKISIFLFVCSSVRGYKVRNQESPERRSRFESKESNEHIVLW